MRVSGLRCLRPELSTAQQDTKIVVCGQWAVGSGRLAISFIFFAKPSLRLPMLVPQMFPLASIVHVCFWPRSKLIIRREVVLGMDPLNTRKDLGRTENAMPLKLLWEAVGVHCADIATDPGIRDQSYTVSGVKRLAFPTPTTRCSHLQTSLPNEAYLWCRASWNDSMLVKYTSVKFTVGGISSSNRTHSGFWKLKLR